MKDDFTMGSCVGLGAMFITGVCNNPFTLLSHQMGLHTHVIDEDHCDLISEFGSHVVKETDIRVEKHFNDALDLLSEWRSSQSAADESLEGGCDRMWEWLDIAALLPSGLTQQS